VARTLQSNTHLLNGIITRHVEIIILNHNLLQFFE